MTEFSIANDLMKALAFASGRQAPKPEFQGLKERRWVKLVLVLFLRINHYRGYGKIKLRSPFGVTFSTGPK